MSEISQDGLDVLLNMDGEEFTFGDGWTTEFTVYRVTPTKGRPHGIDYRLVLLDKHRDRVLCFDNAHHVKPRRKNYVVKVTTWDHVHRREDIRHYEFTSPVKLIEDFWNEVNGITEV